MLIITIIKNSKRLQTRDISMQLQQNTLFVAIAIVRKMLLCPSTLKEMNVKGCYRVINHLCKQQGKRLVSQYNFGTHNGKDMLHMGFEIFFLHKNEDKISLYVTGIVLL